MELTPLFTCLVLHCTSQVCNGRVHCHWHTKAVDPLCPSLYISVNTSFVAEQGQPAAHLQSMDVCAGHFGLAA